MATITPAAPGTVTVDIAAGAAQDGARRRRNRGCVASVATAAAALVKDDLAPSSPQCRDRPAGASS